jgi:ubiquinone biosynthesis protein
MRISEWFRLWQIQTTILRYGLLEIVIDPQSRFQPLIHLRILNPWYWRRNKDSTRGERLRLALQELGPFFVKFGQLLSTRRDILPDDIAEELAKLQDQVAPFTTPDVASIVSESLGQPVNTLFTHFDPIPLASASIAQVHSATLPDGQQVVLKVLRPGIQTIIQRDVFLLKTLVRKIAKHVPQGKRLIHVINEIEQTIFSELDLLREAANMSQLQRQQEHLKYLHIPKVFWSLSRKNLLVLERIHGIPLTDSDAIYASGIDRKVLAERLVQLFFLDVFEVIIKNMAQKLSW